MKKKLLCLAMSGIFAVSGGVLAGCVNGGSTTGPVEEGATVVKIMMREFEQWRNDHFNSLVSAFNSNLHDGIQVEVEYVIEESFNDRLESAREVGAAPDIILHSYNHIYTQVENNNLAALNDYLSTDALNDITDSVKPAIQFNGNTYAYPWYTEASTVLIYSKSKFSEAGIAKAPTTWTEMLEACAKLKPTMSRGTYPLGMPLGGDIGWATWGMTYNQLGGWPVTENWDKSIFGDSQKVRDFARLLDYYGELYDNAYTPVSALHLNGYNEIISAWAEGKYAMTLAVSSQLGTVIQQYPDRLSDLGMAVMPTETGDADAVTATNGGWVFCIDARSKVKEQAGKVIEGLMYTDTERNAEFYEMSGYSRFPALKSVAEKTKSAAATSQYADYEKLVSQICSHAVMEPVYTWNISLQVAWAFDNMIQGTDSSTIQIVQEVGTKIDNMIAVSGMSGKNPNAGRS